MVAHRIIAGLGLVFVLGMLVTGSSTGSSLHAANKGLQGLEGTWELTVIGTPFRVVRTFFEGGGNVDSASSPSTYSHPGATVYHSWSWGLD